MFKVLAYTLDLIKLTAFYRLIYASTLNVNTYLLKIAHFVVLFYIWRVNIHYTKGERGLVSHAPKPNSSLKLCVMQYIVLRWL